MMLKAAIRSATRGRLTVFIYHRVLAEPDPLLPGEPDARRFAEELDWIRQWFQVLPLPEAVTRLYEGDLPPGAAAITFDDGYRDNHDVALPLLRQRGLAATFFVATGFLDGGMMFNDAVIEAVRCMPRFRLGPGSEWVTGSLEEKRRAIDEILRAVKPLEPKRRWELVEAASDGRARRTDLMMTPDQVRALSDAGMTIGAHTIDHPILTSIDLIEARRQITASREALQSITGRPVALFAYPNGTPQRDFAAAHVRLVQEAGFLAAFTTAWGSATSRSDRHQLPRFRPWDRGRVRYGLRLLRNAFTGVRTAS